MKERFLTPSQPKERLSEERVPPHNDFKVGYFEGNASAKCWIVSKEDIQATYNAHFEGDVITIWCDGRGKTEDASVSRKRKKDADDTDTPYLSGRNVNVNNRKYMMNYRKSIPTKNIQIPS